MKISSVSKFSPDYYNLDIKAIFHPCMYKHVISLLLKFKFYFIHSLGVEFLGTRDQCYSTP